MERSLTVLMPVHNVESTLSDMVLETLEVASEQTERLELLIVDDGSSDATSEVVDELIRSYPQVRSVRHGRRLGREAAIRTGMKHARGETVVLHEAEHETSRPNFPMLYRRLPQQIHDGSRPARPNYLGRLKQFALGE